MKNVRHYKIVSLFPFSPAHNTETITGRYKYEYTRTILKAIEALILDRIHFSL